jgi:CBS domain-containing protein
MMARGINATPLIALDAVVFDTETTGLDPVRARLVEIAGVHIAGGKVETTATFRALVNCGEPIPAAATRIHGIDDAMLVDAPTFAEVWPQFLEFVGSRLVIGHTVGFDLAVLKRECERAAIPWRRPRTLDTRLLAEVAKPDLAGHALEELAAWLGVAVTGRHNALGDATLTAHLFVALLPKLREGNIRTLAEAEQACHALTDVLADQHRAGWVEPVMAPARAATEHRLERIDSYPYRHRVAVLMSAPPKFIAPEATVGEALMQMTRERVSSLFVHAAGAGGTPPARETGILTERDIMRTFTHRGSEAAMLKVDAIANRPLVTVPADALVYRAIGRMGRFKIRHLGVTNETGGVCGALSARDLLRLRAERAIELGDEIDDAHDVGELARGWAKLPQVASALVGEGVAARDIAAAISRELAAATRRAGVIAERRMRDDGLGAPPCRYALAVLGSGGRDESLLAMDQDNALMFAEGEPDSAADRWFARLGEHVADILHEIGVPYCNGGVMAKNPQWRGSLATWRARVADWIRRSNPNDVLSVDIFFDLRAVYGDIGLANTLWREGFEMARGNVNFAKLLAETAGEVASGLNVFGGFRTDRGRIDLKKAGLFGIVTTARVLAIRHHVVERTTPARLAGVAALGIGGGEDLAALDEAQAIFLDLILAQQLDDLHHGQPPTNKVATRRLSRADRERLHRALEAVRHLDTLTRDLLFRG